MHKSCYSKASLLTSMKTWACCVKQHCKMCQSILLFCLQFSSYFKTSSRERDRSTAPLPPYDMMRRPHVRPHAFGIVNGSHRQNPHAIFTKFQRSLPGPRYVIVKARSVALRLCALTLTVQSNRSCFQRALWRLIIND